MTRLMHRTFFRFEVAADIAEADTHPVRVAGAGRAILLLLQ